MLTKEQDINVRLLVDQTSGFVVWMSTTPSDLPPIIDPTLNFFHFDGRINIRIRPPYVDYKLYFENGKLVEGPNIAGTDEYTKVQLLRAKATSILIARNILKTNIERLDLANKEYYRQLIEVDSLNSPWVNFYSKEYNCSLENALKLIKFYTDEYRHISFKLETELLHYTNRAKKAKSMKELEDELLTYCNRAMVDCIELSNLPIVRGYE
jgi:hypothetical protein